MIIGLTGQSGAGKTTVSVTFEKKGYFIIDCDVIAHEVVSSNKECKCQLVEAFSRNILDDHEVLNRKKLAKVVFHDKSKLKRLDEIALPFILKTVVDKIKYLNSVGVKKILLDAPTLFEAGAETLCDVVISVIADKEVRLKRIIERDGLSLEEAQARLESQHADSFYISRSKYTVHNDGSLWAFMGEIEKVITQIESIKSKV